VEGVDAPDKHPADIARMFDAISGRYDLLNRLLSGGLDRRWRRQAVDALALTGREVLADICTGTGDLAIEARTRGARAVVGVDFAAAMVSIGRDKVKRMQLGDSVRFVRGDAARLPLKTASADAACVAFGIRNVEDPAAACRELHRVLRSGGRLAILEFGIPTVPVFRALYLWYFRVVLPRIGRWLSRHHSAYAYLPASVGAFPAPVEFAAIVRSAGLAMERVEPLTGGVVYLYVASKRTPL
jgi:demethylmenaquinone methyltransferase/2-methoxy-6-polyprenyl-1,4-benzoquinol methylase